MANYIPEKSRSTLSYLSWRNLRGPADYRVLAAIGQRCNLADHVDDVLTAEDVAHKMEHSGNFEPSVDVAIAEIEGRPVAWQLTQWQHHEASCLYMLRGFVSPGWRRRGIGREMLRRGERRLRQVAAGHPEGVERCYATFTAESRVGKVALFQAEGYTPVRHFYTLSRSLLGNLPEAPLPAGLELRPARPEHWRAIWDANEEAFRDHWKPKVMTEADYERWQQEPSFDPSLFQVAWDRASNQVAGVALNAIPSAANAARDRLRGVVENLSVRRPWRKRGLGKALLVASLRALRERGQAEVALGVDAENITGALRLYESVGFRPIDHGMVFTKPLEVAP